MIKNLFLSIFFLFFIFSCSLPKFIILEDPLSAEEHNDLGVVYFTQKKFKLAEKEFLKAIKKNPKWDLPFFNLGNTYYYLKEYDKSEEYYRKAIKLNNKNADAMNNLAYLLSEQCRLQEATDLINDAIAIQSKNEYLDTLKKIQETQCNN
jgi:Tfp pilus assembly protein PilF